jgi:predicted transcriptional regulator of viral defense system
MSRGLVVVLTRGSDICDTLLIRAVFGCLETARYCSGLVMIDDRRCDVDVSVRASVWKRISTKQVCLRYIYLSGHNNNDSYFTSSLLLPLLET